MIARLADLREFAELKQHFEERQERDVAALGAKSFAAPQNHDSLEWEKLRAFYAGVEAVLRTPVTARREESK